jgi:hypothetical protein
MNITVTRRKIALTTGQIGLPLAGGVDHTDKPGLLAQVSDIPGFVVPRAAGCRPTERNYEEFCVDWFMPESDRAAGAGQPSREPDSCSS